MNNHTDGKDSARFVIIGAGLAGIGAAYGLARHGEGDVLILEKEDLPGLHSSGRNAAMIRQVVFDTNILALAVEGAKFFSSSPGGLEGGVPFSTSGSILAAGGAGWRTLLEKAENARRAGVELEVLERGEIESRIPCTRGGDFEGGVFCPLDGVTDTDRLINTLFRAAKTRGARLSTGCEALAVEVLNGKVRGVKTNRGFIRTDTVVNASGPWAARLAAMAGALPIELTPFRRHLFHTGELSWADPRWPFIWDIGRDVYFRPESSGLLLSPCDETKAEPGIPKVDPGTQDLLAEKISLSFPRLLDLPIAKSWAGLRTFAPDRVFVIGWDPGLKGFYWVVGLGGHGVTTSVPAGSLAAAELLEGRSAAESPFSPARFL